MKNFYVSNFKKLLILFIIIGAYPIQAQTWQWGKRGGGTDNTIFNYDSWEKIQSMATDTNGNIYILGTVGIANVNIDGEAKETYGLYTGGGAASTDGIVASFTCNGTLRWAKVIGGNISDRVRTLKLDANNNVYIAAQIYNIQDNFFFPGTNPQAHIGTEFPIPYAVDVSDGVSTANSNNQSLRLIKYNSEGDLQWTSTPQASDISLSNTGNSLNVDLQVDALGNNYWACYLGTGIYGNGTLTVNQAGMYVLKYNSLGSFTDSILLDIQIGGGAQADFRFVRNHNTGHLYLSHFLSKSGGSNNTAVVGGQTVNFSRYVAAFNAQGTFLWERENNSLIDWSTNSFDLVIDNQNNIYTIGSAGTVGFPNEPDAIMESFNGVQFTAPPGSQAQPCPYIVKMDANGNTLWQTNGFTNYPGSPRAVVLNGNEVALVGGQPGMIWGNINISNNMGYDPYLARFNKETGAIIAIETLTSSTVADDFATAITADAQGNYYVGGMFSNQITVGSSVLQKVGGERDFFLAKFGTSSCSLDVPENKTQGFKAYPNPVQNHLFIDSQETQQYQIYSILGTKISEGTLPVGNSIDCSGLTNGVYFLSVTDGLGNVSTVKFVKQ
ncbi:T9SS type A sorting domain-containing protein [Flavobacterium sp.]|uniref:T9SS type A sorting domain-containing protein n=1 Tax=Flavobacterium sp. TaxID=239 RepID=UPI00261543D3|nr:T9SS type A sorting domain-containing protein [Flavobacterium sp.]MDD3005506.1 T9SS type A sorting domain-containing protein [Flavobacterium sp.]